MKLYYVRKYGNEIEEREYERVTGHFAVKANGRREALSTDYDAMFQTREEAIAWKRARIEKRIECAKRELLSAEQELGTFEKAIQ